MLVVVQVEGLQAVEHAAEIAGIEGVDAVLIGPYDLSQAIGRPGDVGAPEIAEAAGRVAAACRGQAMLGIYVDDPAMSQEWARRGFGLQCVGFDGRMLLDGARSVLTIARGES